MARILIADDERDIRELVEIKLLDLGHEVEVVPDGAAALAACRARRPDLVVLDVMMPGPTGLDTVEAIRSEPGLADLPVVLLTARAQDADVEAGMAAGADLYITKPFSPRDLAGRLEELLADRA